MTGTFLHAEWRKLLMANYAVEEALLKPFVPAGTELDLFEGTCYVSLVGFMFLDTRVLGLRIPYHANFEEVNLRFYVRREDQSGLRRGVVFLREIVPKRAITFVANTLYGEKYVTMPMKHQWSESQGDVGVAYQWKSKRWNTFAARASGRPEAIDAGSEEDFITNHYWGYTRLSDGLTSEYEVVHPQWNVYPVRQFQIDVDFGDVYGATFAFLAQAKPVSVLLAEGSAISVQAGRKLR
jgi:uncharacterized protein